MGITDMEVMLELFQEISCHPDQQECCKFIQSIVGGLWRDTRSTTTPCRVGRAIIKE